MKFFKPDDFAEQEWHPISSAQAANTANQKLQREAKVVYGTLIGDWSFNKRSESDYIIPPSSFINDTHRALLICIEEIERKPCEHQPVGKVFDLQMGFHVVYFTGPEFDSKCKWCGKKLKPTWQVADE